MSQANLTNASLSVHSGLEAHQQTALHDCTHIMFQGMLEQLGWMFYYIKPNSSLFMSVDEVPNYEVQVIICFIV